MAEPFSFQVSTARGAWVWTRNGAPDITRLYVIFSGDGADDVHLDGIGKRGSVLVRSGFRIDAMAMDLLAQTWLQKRGLLPYPAKEGEYAAWHYFGDFAAPDVETAAKEAFAFLDTMSASNFSIRLTDRQGTVHEVDLTQFSVEELLDYAEGGD